MLRQLSTVLVLHSSSIVELSYYVLTKNKAASSSLVYNVGAWNVCSFSKTVQNIAEAKF